MERPDVELVRACLAGDERAWAVLVERYQRLVYSIPVRYGIRGPDADDVFQSVFLTLHRALPALRDVAALPKWLITTTHRACWRRRRDADPAHAAGAEASASADPPPDVAARWEDLHYLHRGLGLLEPRCRDLLRALYLESAADYDTLAVQLGMPRGSLGPTRARCLRKLRDRMLELGFVPTSPDQVSGDASGTS